MPFFRYLSNSSGNGQKDWFSCANFSIAMHVSSVQPISSCGARYVESFRKRSWIPSYFFLRHLLRALWAWKLFLCFSFSVPSTSRSHLLDDVVLDWECVLPPLMKMLADVTFFQEMSTSLIDNSLIPVKKAWCAVRKCFCNSTEVVFASIPPCSTIEINCNQINFSSHDGTESVDELLGNAFPCGTDVANVKREHCKVFLPAYWLTPKYCTWKNTL